MKLTIMKIAKDGSVDYVTNPVEVLPTIMDGQLLLNVYYNNGSELSDAIREYPDELLGDEYESLNCIELIIPKREGYEGYKVMMS